MKKTLLLLTLLSSHTYASSVFDFFHELENGFENPRVLCDPKYYENQKKDEKLFQQCAVSLCGDVDPNRAAVLSDHNFDKYLDVAKMQKFDEFVPAIKDKLARTKKYFIDVAKKLGSEKDMADFIAEDHPELEFTVYPQYTSVEIDHSKPIEKRIRYVSKKIKDKELQAGIDDYIKRQTKLMYSSKSMLHSIGAFTKDELVGVLEELYSKYKSLPQTNRFEEEGYNDNSIEDFYEEAIRDPGDTFAVSKVLTELENAIIVNKQEEDGFMEESSFSKYDCGNSSLCKKGIRAHLKKLPFKEASREYLSRLNDKGLETKIIADCRSNYASTLMKREEENNFAENVKEVKKRFGKNVLGKFSQKSRNEFMNYLNNKLNFSVRYSKESESEQFEADLQYSDYDAYNGKSEASDAVSVLLNMTQFNKRKHDPTPMLNVCAVGSPYLVWDMFLVRGSELYNDVGSTDMSYEKDNIIVSEYSCSHFHHGEGVVAHEIGHALAHQFKSGDLSSESKKKYIKLRQCANANYSFYNLDEIQAYGDGFPSDKLRTEEDTADLISFSYLGKKGKNDTLYSCALIDPSKDATRYADLEIDNIGTGDSHSSGFFRLMKEAVARDVKLSSACESVIKKYKYYGLKKCEL